MPSRSRSVSAATAPYHLYLLGIVLALSLYGVVMVITSSKMTSLSTYGSPFYIAVKHAIILVVSLIMGYVIIRVLTKWERMNVIAPALYIATLILLVLVLIPGIGSYVNGARSWITLGPLAVQPTEVARMTAIIATAHFITTYRDTYKPLTIITVAWAPILILSLLEKDLGMTLMLGACMLCMMIAAGLSLWIVVGASIIVGVVAAILIAFTGFRSQRIFIFLQQFAGLPYDTDGGGYQFHQGVLALVRGGFFGTGLGQGEASFLYLPEGSNDFILAIIGEELGFMGVFIVILLYAGMGWTVISALSHRTFPEDKRLILVMGTFSLLFQAMINIGYVTGLLPVTGLQLPLISAGGTSMMTTIGLLAVMYSCLMPDKSSGQGHWALKRHTPKSSAGKRSNSRAKVQQQHKPAPRPRSRQRAPYVSPRATHTRQPRSTARKTYNSSIRPRPR